MTSELIYDVGFNNGDDTAFYLSQGYRVVAIDANPTLAEAGRERFRTEIESGALQLLNVGISAEEGHAEFWICDEKPQFSSFLRSSASRDGLKHHAIQVPTTRFGKILEQYGLPLYLKIDIEGHEQMCLDALAPSALPQYLSTECESPKDAADRNSDEGLQLLTRLRDLGFRQFKLIHQLTFCDLSVPPSLGYRIDAAARRLFLESRVRKLPGADQLARLLTFRARLEQRFSNPFPPGCSGAWGEDTPGTWLSFADAHASYAHYRELQLQNPTEPRFWMWCDWHAKR